MSWPDCCCPEAIPNLWETLERREKKGKDLKTKNNEEYKKKKNIFKVILEGYRTWVLPAECGVSWSLTQVVCTHTHTHIYLLSCVFICVEHGITASVWGWTTGLWEDTGQIMDRALVLGFKPRELQIPVHWFWLKSDLKLVVLCVCHIPNNKKSTFFLKNYCVLWQMSLKFNNILHVCTAAGN